MKNKKYIYTAALFFMLLDQFIKWIIMKNMDLYQEITLIPNFFSLYFLKNTGAAFSLFGKQTLLLIIISIICLLVLKYHIKKIQKVTNYTIISLGMMIGGIMGNLFDRVLHQAVIDYLSFDFFGYSFPVFNLADIGITVGATLLLIDLIREEIKVKKERD